MWEKCKEKECKIVKQVKFQNLMFFQFEYIY